MPKENCTPMDVSVCTFDLKPITTLAGSTFHVHIDFLRFPNQRVKAPFN